MELNSDITSEDLDVFLQEAEEQLQLLDEAIVQMEQAGNDPQLLQDIFRAAHTIKGSSAMIGYTRMTELAHVMESLLDRVSKGTLTVNTQIVDALLHSLDLIREMKDSLTISPNGAEGADVDISHALAELQAVLTEGDAGAGNAPKAVEDQLVLNSEEDSRLQEALEAGQRALLVDVSISEESSWVVVRCFQVINELSQIGELIGSSPTQQQIEAESVSHRIQIVLATQASESEIRAALDGTDDLTSVDVGHYVPTGTGKSGGSPAIGPLVHGLSTVIDSGSPLVSEIVKGTPMGVLVYSTLRA